MTVLVDAPMLAAALASATPALVIAVRAADAPPREPLSTVERIPGAVDAFLETDFAGPGGGLSGSRPLPSIPDLQASARRWGLTAGCAVVLYDHDGGLQAARGWWVLRWAGVADVRLLDGGFAAWQRAGFATARATNAPPASPGDVELTAGHLPSMTADDAAALARSGVLLDSRIAPNYEGGPTAPGEPLRGHVPGAVSVPAASNLDAAGAFLDDASLRALYRAAGVDGSAPVGVYCGAGMSAAHDVLALATLGIDAPMYVGSWSAWSADPARPAARGPEPG